MSVFLFHFFKLLAAKVYKVTCVYGPLENSKHFDAINVKTTQITLLIAIFLLIVLLLLRVNLCIVKFYGRAAGFAANSRRSS